MILARFTARDGGFGAEFRLTTPGDVIPLHYHDPGFGHGVRCVAGRVLLRGARPGWGCTLYPGEEVAFDGRLPHAIEALEADSWIFNRWEVVPEDAGTRLGAAWAPLCEGEGTNEPA
jgi:hypothetical protein